MRVLAALLLCVRIAADDYGVLPNVSTAAAEEAAVLQDANERIDAYRRFRDELRATMANGSAPESLVTESVRRGDAQVDHERQEAQSNLQEKVDRLRNLRQQLEHAVDANQVDFNVSEVTQETEALESDVHHDRDALDGMDADHREAAIRQQWQILRASTHDDAHNMGHQAVAGSHQYKHAAKVYEHARKRAGVESEGEIEGQFDADEQRSQEMESVAESIRDEVKDMVNDELREADHRLEARLAQLRKSWSANTNTSAPAEELVAEQPIFSSTSVLFAMAMLWVVAVSAMVTMRWRAAVVSGSEPLLADGRESA